MVALRSLSIRAESQPQRALDEASPGIQARPTRDSRKTRSYPSRLENHAPLPSSLSAPAFPVDHLAHGLLAEEVRLPVGVGVGSEQLAYRLFDGYAGAA